MKTARPTAGALAALLTAAIGAATIGAPATMAVGAENWPNRPIRVIGWRRRKCIVGWWRKERK